MRQVLTAGAVSASLFAVLAAAPAAQAGFDGVSKRVASLVGVRTHKHHAHKHYGRYLAKYGQRVTIGHPNNCRQMKRRAVLTGNAYWRYAAFRCVTDRYIAH